MTALNSNFVEFVEYAVYRFFSNFLCLELVDCQNQNLRCKDGICYKKDGNEEVQCFCPDGTKSCQKPASLLDPSPCLNNGSYTNLGDNYFGCHCLPYFTGKCFHTLTTVT